MSDDLIKRSDAIMIMACEMYAEAQSQGYEVDSIDDFIPEAKAWINDAPSIDIVRCQDCKHWVYNFNGCSRNPCTEPWYATDFCNYGERREP